MSGKLKHSGPGENLYQQTGSKTVTDDTVTDGFAAHAVKCWYSEIKNYSFETGESANGKPTGHFTQVFLVILEIYWIKKCVGCLGSI